MQKPTALLNRPPASPQPGPAEKDRRDNEARFGVTATAIALDGIALAFTQAHIVGPSRIWFGLLFVLVVPGWSIIGLLRLRWPAAEVSLTITLGLAVTLLIAQAMLWAHAWHPIWEEIGIGIGALPLLGTQIWRDPIIRSSIFKVR